MKRHPSRVYLRSRKRSFEYHPVISVIVVASVAFLPDSSAPDVGVAIWHGLWDASFRGRKRNHETQLTPAGLRLEALRPAHWLSFQYP